MKIIILSVLWLLLIGMAPAQEPSEQPSNSPPKIGVSEMEPPLPVDRWLDHLKMRDPAEYSRLQKLRQEDPFEFRRVLREHLRQKRSMAGTRGFHHGQHPPMNSEIRKLEEETFQIAKTFHETTDLEKKKTIQVELRSKIQALFDLRETERLEQIRRIEMDLAKLKATLDQRQKNREQIIEQRLKELTNGEELRTHPNW